MAIISLGCIPCVSIIFLFQEIIDAKYLDAKVGPLDAQIVASTCTFCPSQSTWRYFSESHLLDR